MLVPNVVLEGRTVLVTGAAGFIGSALCEQLLVRFPGIKVVGIDSVTDYYDVRLKDERLSRLSGFEEFTFVRGSIADKALVERVFGEYRPSVVLCPD